MTIRIMPLAIKHTAKTTGKAVRLAGCLGIMFFRQYRIIQVCGLRSKIFRQVVQINQGKADALPRFFGQADGIICKQAVRLEWCGVASIKSALLFQRFKAKLLLHENHQRNADHNRENSAIKNHGGK